MLTEPTPIYTAYSRHVSFDTLDTRDSSRGALTSLTLNYKHKDYKASRHGRTYLCGLDTSDDYSEFALEWLIDELIEDGDEVVCLRIVDRDSIIDAKRCQTEGKKLFDSVITNMGGDEKAISLAMELAVGKIHHLVQDMVCTYISRRLPFFFFFFLSVFFFPPFAIPVNLKLALYAHRSKSTNQPP